MNLRFNGDRYLVSGTWYLDASSFHPGDSVVEGHHLARQSIGVSDQLRLRIDKSQQRRELQLTAEFGQGADRDPQKPCQLPAGAASRSFGDVGRDTDCGRSHLRRQAESLVGRHPVRDCVDLSGQFDRASPHFQTSEIMHPHTSTESDSAMAGRCSKYQVLDTKYRRSQ